MQIYNRTTDMPEDELTEEIIEEIDGFLNRKKKNVFWALAGLESASQKELAEASATSPTSLSNILSKFEAFPYKLLEGKDRGRNRIYCLTELGRAYVRKKTTETADSEKGLIIFHEEFLLQQKMRDSVDRMKARNDEWKIAFDYILLKRIYGIEEDYAEADEADVNEYVENLQTALMKELYGAVDKANKLLEDEILINRLEKFLIVFYAFVPFLQKLEKKEAVFEIYEVFRRLIRYGEDEECRELLRTIGLLKQGHVLADVMRQLYQQLSGKDRKAIYMKMEGLMPGMNAVNAYLASWISAGE